MSLWSVLRRPVVGASLIVAAAIAVTLSVLTQRVIYAGLFVGLVSLGGGLISIARERKVDGPVTGALLGGAVVAGGLVVLIDFSVIEDVIVAVVAGLGALATHSLVRNVRGGELADETLTALRVAGVELAEESVGGWRVGASTNGVVALRAGARGEGDVASWPSVRVALSEATSVRTAVESKGLAPALLCVVDGVDKPTTVGELVVCAPSQIPGVLRRSAPRITDARVAMESAGMTASRATTRAVERAGKKGSGGRVVHQGRVTRKAP